MLIKKLKYILMATLVMGCLNQEVQLQNEENQYIVVLNKSQVQFAIQSSSGNVLAADVIRGMTRSLALRHGLQVKRSFTRVIQGGVYYMNSEQAKKLKSDPEVAYIEKDHKVSVDGIQANVTWGLDRIDQTNLPLNQSYTYPEGGSQVNAYVIDTGVLSTHVDFNGRSVSGIDTVDNDNDATDCNGHGTHVAGTIGGATYGVAKGVKVHGVRVLDCSGSGQYSDVIAGIEWVTNNHVKPAVANMSLGGPVSQAVDDAINASIQAGVTYVVAAGNSNTSACNSSPSRVSQAITVGSTTISDQRSSFSNYGSCVDIFAPGSDILSTWFNSNSATNTISGTSMASPHVAGAVALYLASHPNAHPADVKAALLAGASSGKVGNPGSGSPNLLLNIESIDSGDDSEDDDNGDDDNGEDDDNGDNDNGDEGDNVLESGKTLTNLSGLKGQENIYQIEVPANSTSILVEINGGTGDADLYLQQGQEPTLTTYSCRPYKSGNSETCKVDSPVSGTWYVMLRGYAAYSNLSLKATVAGETDAPCNSCQKQVGQLTGTGSSQIHPDGSYYHSTSGEHQLWLKGPDSTDFDIYLELYKSGNWVEVAKSISSKSTENINYSGVTGYYRVRVISYRGGGGYELWLSVPQ